MRLPEYPQVWSSETRVRGIFNNHIRDGNYTEVILASRHPSRPGANEPRCTRSQYISYRNANDDEVARAHRYLRPDGSLGASGMPDPKAVLFEGTVYYCDMGY